MIGLGEGRGASELPRQGLVSWVRASMNAKKMDIEICLTVLLD